VEEKKGNDALRERGNNASLSLGSILPLLDLIKAHERREFEMVHL
jgi:hypothetical protein